MEEQYDNLAAWCESTKSKMARDNFTEVTAQLKIAINKTPEYAKLTSENLKIESSQDEIRNEFIKLFKETEKLNQMLNDFEENVEKHRSDKEILIVIGKVLIETGSPNHEKL